MSYDVIGMAPACTHCGREEEALFSWNMTSNMAPAWRAAGADLATFEGKRASECIPILAAAIETMEARRSEFERFNAPNGWGSIETLIPALHELVWDMRAAPNSIIRVRR